MPRPVHFEIHADDCQRAVDFYRALFAWEFTQWGGGAMEYWLVKTGPDGQPGINGGLMKRPCPVTGDGVIAYVCTIDVPNLDEYLAKSAALNAPVALPKQAIPGVGWLAYIKDSEGNVVGMMQFDKGAK